MINIQDLINGSHLEDNFAGLADGSEMHYNAAWQTYSPTWTTSGTQPSIGNGTLTGRYIKIGRLVFCKIFFQAGSSTTFGTGGWLFALPFNNSTVDYPTGHHTVGECYLEDNAVVGYVGVIRILSTQQNKIQLSAMTATGTWAGDSTVTATVPFTWANTDWFTSWFFYESEE